LGPQTDNRSARGYLQVVTPAIDRSCGFATCYMLLVTRSGTHLELPPAAKASAEAAAQEIRAFLGLA
jgi:hypothetical protein